jgi:hypothetical protein
MRSGGRRERALKRAACAIDAGSVAVSLSRSSPECGWFGFHTA